MWEGVHIHNICRLATCSFIKRLTHTYWFNGFGLLCRSTGTPWNACIRFLIVFFSSTILQYKNLKIWKSTFLMNLVINIKESKVLYYRQVVFHWAENLWTFSNMRNFPTKNFSENRECYAVFISSIFVIRGF